MTDIDPYSGLVVSMHRTGLWQSRYGKIKHPAGRYNLTKLSPEVQAFIARNETRQEELRASLDAKGIWTNYRLMQVWDLLGLYFCCQEPYEDFVEPVPVSYAGGDDDGVRMAMKPVGPRRVEFAPYPFDVRPLAVQLTLKRLPQADVSGRRRHSAARGSARKSAWRNSSWCSLEADGRMFWFRRKTLSGSYLVLSATSRSHAGPYADADRVRVGVRAQIVDVCPAGHERAHRARGAARPREVLLRLLRPEAARDHDQVEGRRAMHERRGVGGHARHRAPEVLDEDPRQRRR